MQTDWVDVARLDSTLGKVHLCLEDRKVLFGGETLLQLVELLLHLLRVVSPQIRRDVAT